MAITIKSQEEIEKMRIAGQLAADVLEMIAPHVKAGVSTDELNTLCADYTEKSDKTRYLLHLTTITFQSLFVLRLIMLFVMVYLMIQY